MIYALKQRHGHYTRDALSRTLWTPMGGVRPQLSRLCTWKMSWYPQQRRCWAQPIHHRWWRHMPGGLSYRNGKSFLISIFTMCMWEGYQWSLLRILRGGSQLLCSRRLFAYYCSQISLSFRGKLVVRASFLLLNMALVRCRWVSWASDGDGGGGDISPNLVILTHPHRNGPPCSVLTPYWARPGGYLNTHQNVLQSDVAYAQAHRLPSWNKIPFKKDNRSQIKLVRERKM